MPYCFTTVHQSPSIESHHKQNEAFYINPTATANELITANVSKRISTESTNINVNQEETPEEIQRFVFIEHTYNKHDTLLNIL